jgi:hypothetical protein
MDIGFEHNSWLPAPAPRAFAGDCGAMPEWLALQSRLGAAWSARRQLSYGAGTAAPRCGSFDHEAARELAQFEYASRAVNPIASGNRKPAWGIADHHAGDLTSGGRG